MAESTSTDPTHPVLTYRWRIYEFYSKNFHVSPTFTLGDRTFAINAYPDTHSLDANVRLHLKCYTVDTPIIVRFSIALIHKHLSASHGIGSDPRIFTKEDNRWGWFKFMDHAAFKRFLNEDGSVIVQVSLTLNPDLDTNLWKQQVDYVELTDIISTTRPDLTTETSQKLIESVLASPVQHDFAFSKITEHLRRTGFAEQLLGILYESEMLYDVVVIASGTEFKCHRDVLTIKSAYFKALFANSFAEVSSDIAVVEIVDIDAATFALLRKYMYIHVLDIDTDLFALIVAANKLMIDVGELIPLTVVNCLTILDAALYISSDDLVDIVLDYVSQQFTAIPTASWLDISADCIMVLIEFFMSNLFTEKICKFTVNDLSIRIIEWLDHDFDQKQQHLELLLNHKLVSVFFYFADPAEYIAATYADEQLMRFQKISQLLFQSEKLTE